MPAATLRATIAKRPDIAMIYGLLELAVVLIVIGILTAPFWARGLFGWMTRPFGAPSDETERRRDDGDDSD